LASDDGLAGMQDSMAQIQDIPRNPGQVATLIFSGKDYHIDGLYGQGQGLIFKVKATPTRST